MIRYICLLILSSLTLADPRVRIEQGTVKGSLMMSREGREFYAFQGIPYAAPPVGDLRFKSPQKPLKWSDEFNATEEGNVCPQIHIIFNTYVGDEDCLVLNVYTPRLEGSPLSVMFYIHGGGFLILDGGTEFYGPHFLMDREVVLVTINYRLGALGFLSLGNEEVPGNYGLKDQVAALKWVQRNIAQFGGNPNSVTIFGQSAGGASVQYLLFSPLAEGLFHRAIAQSGSVFNPWAFTKNASPTGYALANAVGCTESVVSCLREIGVQEIVETANELYLNTLRIEYEKRTAFTPTVEPPGTPNAFLTEDPKIMMRNGNIKNVPLMAGLNTHEGVLHFFVLRNWTTVHDYYANFVRFIPAEIRKSSKEAIGAKFDIEKFYSRLTLGDFIQQYIMINSDVDFVLGIDEFVQEMASLKRSPVYYYQFSYNGGLGMLKNLKFPSLMGTAHGDELGYLFSRQLWQSMPLASFWHSDSATIHRITTLWTNFAKTGNPTPNGELEVHWQPVDVSSGTPASISTNYLDIGVDLIMKNNLNSDRIAFWKKLTNKWCPS